MRPQATHVFSCITKCLQPISKSRPVYRIILFHINRGHSSIKKTPKPNKSDWSEEKKSYDDDDDDGGGNDDDQNRFYLCFYLICFLPVFRSKIPTSAGMRAHIFVIFSAAHICECALGLWFVGAWLLIQEMCSQRLLWSRFHFFFFFFNLIRLECCERVCLFFIPFRFGCYLFGFSSWLLCLINHVAGVYKMTYNSSL